MPRCPAERPATPPAGTRWQLPVLTVAAGTQFFRLNLWRYGDPAYFGRGAANRFDAPDGSFGVIYLETSLDCCVLEVLRPTRRPGTADRLLTLPQLREYYAAVCTVAEPLVLAYLADDRLARAGIDLRGTMRLLLDGVLKEREEGEGLRAFGGDELSYEELMYLLRPNSYPMPLHAGREQVTQDRRTYLKGLRLFSVFLAKKEIPLVVANLRREHVEAFIADLMANWKPATAHNRYGALHGFFR